MQLQFDEVLKEWMNELIDFLKVVCKHRTVYECLGVLDKPGYEYFTLADSVTSQLFYFIMNEELSNSSANFALKELCEFITLDKENNEVNMKKFAINFGYMKELAVNQFNAYFQGQLYDYYVSMWSCFEYSISAIFLPLQDEAQKDLNSSQIKNLKKVLNNKILCKINCEDSIKSEIIKEIERNSDDIIRKLPKYISFVDKINFLFVSDLLKDYSRDRKMDKNILLYCGALRNTIHNNGVHRKNDIEIELNDHIFKLKKDTKTYFENYKDIMIIIREIFDIYIEIIKNVTDKLYFDQTFLQK
ncbi:hypothetical protein [Clostridium ihumii]|uniref:hypothetical protein n=1 Tax=Clostridium ihumii TaxID=1470356 RepID=UPI003D3342D5